MYEYIIQKRVVKRPKITIRNAQDIKKVFGDWLFDGNPAEKALIIIVDHKDRLIGYYKYQSSSDEYLILNIRDIIRVMILSGETDFYFCHVHPDIYATPSIYDRTFTKYLYIVSMMLGFNLRDHFIFSLDKKSYSMKSHNIIFRVNEFYCTNCGAMQSFYFEFGDYINMYEPIKGQCFNCGREILVIPRLMLLPPEENYATIEFREAVKCVERELNLDLSEQAQNWVLNHYFGKIEKEPDRVVEFLKEVAKWLKQLESDAVSAEKDRKKND